MRGGLLDELLQLARADAGERMQQSKRVFLDDVAMDAIAAWSPAATRAGVSLVVRDVQEAPIRVDPLLVRRLIDTVLENAVRYTPGGGRIEASVRPSGDRNVLEVSDTGMEPRRTSCRGSSSGSFEARGLERSPPKGAGWDCRSPRGSSISARERSTLSSGAEGGTSVRVSLPIDAPYQ